MAPTSAPRSTSDSNDGHAMTEKCEDDGINCACECTLPTSVCVSVWSAVVLCSSACRQRLLSTVQVRGRDAALCGRLVHEFESNHRQHAPLV